MSNIIAGNSVIHDPLPSWHEGSVKTSILKFIENLTTESNPKYVPIEKRVAALDFDGTLMPEKLMPAQSKFLLENSVHEVKSLCKTVYDKVEKTFSEVFSLKKATTEKKLQEVEEKLSFKNLTKELLLVENYRRYAEEWIENDEHPILKRPYKDSIYQPMQEFVRLLQDHQFKVYVVSGSGQEFLRSIIPRILNIPKENIFGTLVETKTVEIDGKKNLKFTGKINTKNNHEIKVETIKKEILEDPQVVVGNSDGDKEMLLYALQKTHCLALMIHHTDRKKEFKYGHLAIAGGKLTEETRKSVVENGGMIVSMKKCWKKVFSDIEGPAEKEQEILIKEMD